MLPANTLPMYEATTLALGKWPVDPTGVGEPMSSFQFPEGSPSVAVLEPSQRRTALLPDTTYKRSLKVIERYGPGGPPVNTLAQDEPFHQYRSVPTPASTRAMPVLVMYGSRLCATPGSEPPQGATPRLRAKPPRGSMSTLRQSGVSSSSNWAEFLARFSPPVKSVWVS